MAELTKEFFEETLDKKLKEQSQELKAYSDEQTDEIGRMVNDAFQEHQDNFLQAQFDRLHTELSLATEMKMVKIDIKEILTNLQQMKQRVEKLENS